MAFDLSGFKTALTHGGARPSLFEFTFSATPEGIDSSLSSMNLFCNVTEIPPLTISPIDRVYFGRTVKIPGEMTFGDLSTDLINTESFQVRNEIEKWMDLINGNMTNHSFTDSTSMYGQSSITHYQKDGSKVQTYSFVDIWPTTCGEIALDYGTANDIETFNVTWSYNYYTSLGEGVAATNGSQI
tara:strand:- start:983 stop:1537 length:555 start_codon:yes stop_codon:yes gene_type:complete